MQTIQENINVQAIYDLFEEYRNAYGREWERLEKCERMYRGDHWHDVPEADPGEPRPVTPIIQSTIENIRADLVDQYPQAIITADSPEYGEVAEMLTGAIRKKPHPRRVRQRVCQAVPRPARGRVHGAGGRL